MGKLQFYSDFRKSDQFTINYPYYGLFGSATVTRIQHVEGVMFKCALLNGTFIIVKKSLQKWEDTELKSVTPLSSIIGSAIDDFLTREKEGK